MSPLPSSQAFVCTHNPLPAHVHVLYVCSSAESFVEDFHDTAISLERPGYTQFT